MAVQGFLDNLSVESEEIDNVGEAGGEADEFEYLTDLARRKAIDVVKYYDNWRLKLGEFSC
ncbi:hypothetical protein Vqi01_01440 [Micromonospora qiuiae]|uniref:Uncharacterized protein n=1 Tax=Micromonospora qiuiae TaxID=502268 RepID=A0ABQ4J489_9ACTN|nr:hypothetical protein Vqi01_01440 [Micromonospora qiuiae]